jgi:hypothetical protein
MRMMTYEQGLEAVGCANRYTLARGHGRLTSFR